MRNHDEERMLAAKNEYEILEILDHKSIVKVTDFFVTDREIYTVMEYIDG